jgi:hypothetical protein
MPYITEQIHPFKSGYILLYTRYYEYSMSLSVDIYPSCYYFSEKAKNNFKKIISDFMFKYGDRIEKGSIAIIGKRTLDVSSNIKSIINKLKIDIKSFLYDLENYKFVFDEKSYPATVIEKNGGKIQFYRKILRRNRYGKKEKGFLFCRN